ncbi:MAG: hypothetical protein JNM88_09230 [Chitinophagaceae bacterium]|nr:hypothetical protein [Chitinophagaceae bacterium]
MIKGYLIIVAAASIYITACSNTLKSVSGTYVLDKVPKTTLLLNPNRSFIFIKANENPYFYVSDHIEERFFITKGNWYLAGNRVKLTSTNDSLVYDLVTILFDTTQDLQYSKFRFFDIYGDCIGSGPIQYPDSSQLVNSGGGRKFDFYSFGEDMSKVSNLEFIFYGYGPWKYVPKDSLHHDMIIRFVPAFRPNVFDRTPFKIRDNILIKTGKNHKYKFYKTTTAGNIDLPHGLQTE